MNRRIHNISALWVNIQVVHEFLNGEPKNPIKDHLSVTQNPLYHLWLLFISTTTLPSQCTSGNTASEAVSEAQYASW